MISFCKHSPDDNRSHFRQQAVPWTSICIYAWYLIWETSLDMENQTNLWMRVWEINLCTWPIRFWQIHKYSVYDRPIWASESNVYETNLYIWERRIWILETSVLFVCSIVCLFVCLFSYSQVALGYTVHSRLCRYSTLCRGAALHSVATAVAVTYSLSASLGGYSSSVTVSFSQFFTRSLQQLL